MKALRTENAYRSREGPLVSFESARRAETRQFVSAMQNRCLCTILQCYSMERRQPLGWSSLSRRHIATITAENRGELIYCRELRGLPRLHDARSRYRQSCVLSYFRAARSPSDLASRVSKALGPLHTGSWSRTVPRLREGSRSEGGLDLESYC